MHGAQIKPRLNERVAVGPHGLHQSLSVGVPYGCRPCGHVLDLSSYPITCCASQTRAMSATRPTNYCTRNGSLYVSSLTVHSMYGRSPQAYRWHVPHANDRTQRMDRFSYSRYVSSRSYLIPDSIYFLHISVSSTSFTTRTESQHLLIFYSSSNARRLYS
jgi:hypothetical protein